MGMKTPFLLIASTLLITATGAFADSKRTAEFILSDPKAYEGKEVTLDVAMVKPVKWVSPLPEYAFFHAVTLDRRDRKPGGTILVAIPADTSAAFAKKYGTDFEGRNNMTSLRGSFIAIGGGDRPRPKIWIVDTTGNLLQTIADKKASMPDAAFDEGAMGAGPGGPRKEFPGRGPAR